MAISLIKLPTPQVGIMRITIDTLIAVSTKKELKRLKATLFGWLHAVQPNKLTDFKSEDLTFIRLVYDARNLDTFYEFWYEHHRDEVQ